MPENSDIRGQELSKRSSSLGGHSLSVPLECQPAQNYRHDTINPAIYIAPNSANIFSNTKLWVVLTASLIISFLTFTTLAPF